MCTLEVSNFEIDETEGVFTFKNENTTICFVRFKSILEYPLVALVPDHPIFTK